MAEREQLRGAHTETPLRYPKDLVHHYGAKAGLLIYIARELPNIPQMPMVVNEPGETTENFIRRVDRSGMGWPRLFRSSAVAELQGYEGEFPTTTMYGYDEDTELTYYNPERYPAEENFFRRMVMEAEDVITSPRFAKQSGHGQELPDRINVIAVERSPSTQFGTYVKHPNQDNRYLFSVINANGGRDPDKAIFSLDKEKRLERFGTNFGVPNSDSLREGLKEVAAWHDQITALSEIDQDWAYQIEFGVNPNRLYQVRPFLPKKKADFSIDPDPYQRFFPIPIGITPPEGIVTRVLNADKRSLDIGEINSRNEPVLYLGPLRDARQAERLRSLKVNALQNSDVLLSHNDIRAIKLAEVTILFLDAPKLEDGSWVRVISDGYTARIEPIAA